MTQSFKIFARVKCHTQKIKIKMLMWTFLCFTLHMCKWSAHVGKVYPVFPCMWTKGNAWLCLGIIYFGLTWLLVTSPLSFFLFLSTFSKFMVCLLIKFCRVPTTYALSQIWSLNNCWVIYVDHMHVIYYTWWTSCTLKSPYHHIVSPFQIFL
jgi:hypothetical protein